MNQEFLKLLGPIAKLYENSNVFEILVDAIDDVYYEEDGKIHNSDIKFSSNEELIKVIKDIYKFVGKEIKTSADCRLPDGTRAMAVLPPLATSGPAINFRRSPINVPSWSDLKKWNSITDEGIEVLRTILSKSSNILMIGNTGSGKTTVANLMIDLIPEEFRLVILEKVANLKIDRRRTICLQALDNLVENMVELTKSASLMRSDYIMLDEVRGEEVSNMLNMFREGYNGLITIHAENVIDGLKRLETKYLNVNYNLSISDISSIVSSAVDYIVFQERLPGGRRVLSEISRLKSYSDGKYEIVPLYIFDKEREQFLLTSKGHELKG